MHVVDLTIFGRLFTQADLEGTPALRNAAMMCREAPRRGRFPGDPYPMHGIGFREGQKPGKPLYWIGVVLDEDGLPTAPRGGSSPQDELCGFSRGVIEGALVDAERRLPPDLVAAFQRFEPGINKFKQTRECRNHKVFMQLSEAGQDS